MYLPVESIAIAVAVPDLLRTLIILPVLISHIFTFPELEVETPEITYLPWGSMAIASTVFILLFSSKVLWIFPVSISLNFMYS